MTRDTTVTLPRIAQEMLSNRDEFISALFEVIHAEIAELAHDSRMRTLLKSSIAENIISAVTFLEHGTSVDDLDAPATAITYARSLAQRDVPLSALIRAYRLGHSRFLDTSLTYVSTLSGDDHMDTVIEIVNRSASYIDKVCDQVGRAYELERDRWVSSRSGLRQNWVAQILDGSRTDLQQTEADLGYTFVGTHIAFEVWPLDEITSFDIVELFDDVRDVLATCLKARGRALLVPHDEREVRIWLRVDPRTVVDSVAIAQKLKVGGLAVGLAIGSPETGVDGFRRTLTQASRVKQVQTVGGRSAQVLTYSEVAPTALMAGDIAQLQDFVVTTLAALGADDERCRSLRETLRTFLDRNRSFSATSEVMMLHRNTIQYRVQKALELCGHTLDTPGTAFTLQSALEAAHWLGSTVLAPESR